MRQALSAIAAAGLVAGALDIISACIHAATRGVPPVRVLQFVASGLIGQQSLQGGLATAALGLGLHFVIALGAAAVFYAASRKLTLMLQRPISAGLIFGLAVWLAMKIVVVPLSAATPRSSLSSDLIQIAIHLLAVGLPISLLIRPFSGVAQS